MHPVAGSQPTATAASLESDAQRMGVALEKGKLVCLLAITLLFAAGAMLHARAKPFWYDEIFTVLSASAPDAAGTLKLAPLLDAGPPLPHLLTHFAFQWFGRNEVTARLPAMAGFWVFCLSLFWFVRRRLGIFYGLTALLLPLATEAYDYAYEARAYGLELGFCGLMLLCWQAAAESGPRRPFGYFAACAGIAVSLMGALLCHYYAVLLFLPLAGGEAWRCWKARSLHWGVWLAMAGGAAPLVWKAAAIRSTVHGFSQTSWSELYPIQVLDFWNDGLRAGLSVLVLALAIMALWAWKSPHLKPAAAWPTMPPHELLAGILFLTVPAFALGFGILVTHVYSSRYALAGYAGVALLLPAVAAHMARGRTLPAFLMLALASLRLIVVSTTIPPPRDPVAEETVLVDALKQGPVVVADGQLFAQMWYYLPVSLKPNLHFLVDAEASVKYQAFNTAAIDSAMSAVRHAIPMTVLDYRDYAVSGREFRLLQNPLKPGWMLEKIAADGGRETIARYTNLRQLYTIRMP